MKSTRTTVTITLSEGAIDALKVLSMVDMRSKSHEIEYLIIDAVERRNLSHNSITAIEHAKDQAKIINMQYAAGDNNEI